MKTWIVITSLFMLLQTDSCSSDDSQDDGGSINENFVEFLDVRSDANGGCNVETSSGGSFSCTYVGSFVNNGLSYTISVTHSGVCRTATFNMRNNIDQPGNALVLLQGAENGQVVSAYFGSTGSIQLTDSGTITTIDFNGIVINNETGEEEDIIGFMECIL